MGSRQMIEEDIGKLRGRPPSAADLETLRRVIGKAGAPLRAEVAGRVGDALRWHDTRHRRPPDGHLGRRPPRSMTVFHANGARCGAMRGVASRGPSRQDTRERQWDVALDIDWRPY
jgi:hypothetical protein